MKENAIVDGHRFVSHSVDQTTDFGILVFPWAGVAAAADEEENRIQTFLFLFDFCFTLSTFQIVLKSLSHRERERLGTRPLHKSVDAAAVAAFVPAHLLINGPPQHACPGRAPPHLSSARLLCFVSVLLGAPLHSRGSDGPPSWGPHHVTEWMNEWMNEWMKHVSCVSVEMLLLLPSSFLLAGSSDDIRVKKRWEPLWRFTEVCLLL